MALVEIIFESIFPMACISSSWVRVVVGVGGADSIDTPCIHYRNNKICNYSQK